MHPFTNPKTYRIFRALGAFLWSVTALYLTLSGLCLLFVSSTRPMGFDDAVGFAPAICTFSVVPAFLSLLFPLPDVSKVR